jgi:LmbE family N-acetylglucosaminyl deacetylase
MKTILLAFAHPRDESFAAGILSAKYAANGWKVHLISATHGEVNHDILDENISRGALGQLRKTDLEEAARILGISSLSYMGYKEGMLKNQTDGELEDKIYKKIVELTPDVVVTFDTTGINNDPDHVKMCYSTTYSFQRYCQELEDTRKFVSQVNQGDKTAKIRNFTVHHKYALKQKSFADVVQTDTEPKLYYAAIPETTVKFLQKNHVIPVNFFDRQIVGTPDKFITTVIDGKKFQTKKVTALKSHASQNNDIERFASFLENPVLHQECFILRMHGTTEVFMGKNDRVLDRL